MKNILRTFTFCLVISVVNFTAIANSFLFINFCRPLLDRTRNRKTNRKNKNETKKEERQKKTNLQRIKREETQNASVYYGKHESGE